MPQSSYLPFALITLFSGMAFADIAPDAPLPSGPGVNTLQITFDQDPKEEGLSFDRSEPHATTVQVQGQSCNAWVSEKGVTPNMLWARSFRFHVTDPRFQKGGRPVVELEFTVYMPKPGSVLVSADTTDGNQRILDHWYKGPAWETYRVPLDNAFFGARPDAPNEKIPLEGYDFRIDAPNSQLYMQSIKLVGYDTEHDVIFSKMLKVDRVTTDGPGDILLWQHGPGQKLGLTLHNLSAVSSDLHYRLQIADRDDKVRFAKDEKISLKPSTANPLSWTVDTQDWPLGPYAGTFEVFSDAKPGDVLFSKTFRLGIISSTVLDKAREGEFLYGLDVANNSIYPVHTPTALAYFRLMGVDILRNTFEKGMKGTLEDLGVALAQLKDENLQSTMMCDPPRDPDPVKMAAALQAREAFLEEAERLYGGRGPGKLRYYELGNEPDLPRFYPGPISDYTRDFYAMREAIKRGGDKAGLPETESVVTTGGLSFAGLEGPPRAEEIIKDFDPTKIDAIAYHGHGPGINAERSAYERVHAVAEKYDKAHHPFMETESGFSGQGPNGLQLQARTAIEKMVYAQSKGEPLLIFFRLFMEGDRSDNEGGYGMTDNFVEPQPSIMAYRNLVERLRHQAYAATLDIAEKTGAVDTDGFVFAEKDANGNLIGRKTAVVFTENPSHEEIRLRLDLPDAKITDAKLYDMYGNPSTVTIADGNIVNLTAGEDPVYLSWTSPGDPTKVDLVPPMLALGTKEPLLVGADNEVDVIVRNVGTHPLTTNVSLAAQTRVSGETSPSNITVTVPPNQSATASFKVKLGTPGQPLALPVWWKVFPDVDIDKANLPGLNTIPETLPGTSGDAKGQFVWAPNRHINIGKVAGGFADKRPAVVLAYIDSDADTVLPIAASADWYMAWYVNGAKTYDNLAVGNKAGTLADHAFDLPLKKGRNLIAVEVLSGSGGWALEFGGPKERQIAVSGGTDPDGLTITAKSDNETASSLVVPVALQDFISKPKLSGSLDSLVTWMSETPLAVLDETSVKNLWMKEPDSSKWYGGKSDLSGTIWLGDTNGNLELFANITDDKHIDATSPQTLSQGDAVHVVIADESGKTLLDITGGLINGKPILDHAVPGVNFTGSLQTTAEGGPGILYRLEIPKSLVGTSPFRLNLSVLDNDSSFLKQTMDLGDTSNPLHGLRLKAKE